ncbi:MAG: hypothetical protein KatS3mg027_1660 [Bacteroidia bacterium]|nr:MAG: hypothetical protein KatS3mg027_1660 [Bacteroidia bacterium]
MTFQERLKLYMIGFLIGLILVYALFGTRTCTSLSEVKISELKRQTLKLSEKSHCQIKCLKKSSSQLKSELEFFEINFDKSQPREKPCRIYFLEPREQFKKFYPYQIIVKDCDETTVIEELIFQNTSKCQCP